MTELTHYQDAPLTTITYTPERNPALVYLASVSESSRRPITQSLNVIAGILGVDPVVSEAGKEVTYLVVPWGEVRYSVSQAIRQRLGDLPSAATANRHLSALRGVLKEAWRLGYMSAEDYQRAVDLKPIKGQKVAQGEAGRHLASGEIKALLDACYDDTAAGLRDAAIIALGYGCGLRRSELASLTLENYDHDQQSLTIIAGKGNKDRVAYLPAGAASALGAWLAVRGATPGAMFLSIRRGDHIQAAGVTDQAVYNILASRAQIAGIKRFTPHDLRRTFAGDLLDAGEDISTVQKMMGHSSANTTAGYDRRDAKAKKRAASKLHVPVRGQLF